MPNMLNSENSQIDRIEDPPLVNMRLSVSPEAYRLRSEVANDLGIPKGTAIVKAIALLKAAADARKSGRAVGAAVDAESLETEFVGF